MGKCVNMLGTAVYCLCCWSVVFVGSASKCSVFTTVASCGFCVRYVSVCQFSCCVVVSVCSFFAKISVQVPRKGAVMCV